MKASKKQIAEVTRIAEEMKADLSNALSTLNNCSLSIFKAIGAKGVVESSLKAANIREANNDGGILFDRCEIIGNTEKAYLLGLPMEAGSKEVWVAKAAIKTINGNTIVPFWAIK